MLRTSTKKVCRLSKITAHGTADDLEFGGERDAQKAFEKHSKSLYQPVGLEPDRLLEIRQDK